MTELIKALNNPLWTDIVQAIFLILAFFASIVALLFSISANNKNRKLLQNQQSENEKRLKQERFDEFMKEYRSKYMHECLKVLNRRFDEEKKKIKKAKGIDTVKKIEEELLKKLCQDDDFDYKRRYVSHFLRMLSQYYFDKRILEKDVESIWDSDNTKIISKIILPCEDYLIKSREKNKISETSENTLKLLQDFFYKMNKNKKNI